MSHHRASYTNLDLVIKALQQRPHTISELVALTGKDEQYVRSAINNLRELHSKVIHREALYSLIQDDGSMPSAKRVRPVSRQE